MENTIKFFHKKTQVPYFWLIDYWLRPIFNGYIVINLNLNTFNGEKFAWFVVNVSGLFVYFPALKIIERCFFYVHFNVFISMFYPPNHLVRWVDVFVFI